MAVTFFSRSYVDEMVWIVFQKLVDRTATVILGSAVRENKTCLIRRSALVC